MKKIIALILAVCLFLCSCSKIEEIADSVLPDEITDVILPEEEVSYNFNYWSFSVIIPGAIGYNEIFPQNCPDTVKNVYEDAAGNGYIIILKTRSDFSSDDMEIDVAITSDGVICDISIEAYYESKDFGEDYPKSFIGENSALSGVDIVAGTTYSSTAFKNAVKDAFAVLIENNLIKAGEKNEEQKIEEVIKVIFPGCFSDAGTALITPIECSDPITEAYKANNDCGYIYVMVGGSYGSVVVGVNAFGEAKVYSLDGDDITEDCEGIAEDAASAAPIIAEENIDSNTVIVKAIFGNGATITPNYNIDSFSNVVGAFTVSENGKNYYAVFTNPFGYGNEAMKIVVVLDSDGKITKVHPVTPLILHSEYYSAHGLTDEDKYLNRFIGLTNGTFNGDETLVAGATMTANAVSDAIKSAFETFEIMN